MRRVGILLVAGGCFFPDLSFVSVPMDAGMEAGEASPGDASEPMVLANVGSVLGATGNAQQTHVVWAIGAQRWWLFYIDQDPTVLKTRWSTDFVTWNDGASLVLGHTNGGDARNFSVAYASLGGHDVVHIVLAHALPNGTLIHAHARGVITGSTLAFSTPADVSMANGVSGPDGPATLIDGSGVVWDASGFAVSVGSTNGGHYNEDVFSSAPDDGTSWSAGFTQQTLEIVDPGTNAHCLVSGAGVGALWTTGVPDPANIRLSIDSSGWSQPFSIFDTDDPTDSNDWGVAVLNGSEGHILRAPLGGGYHHAYGVGTNGMNAAAPPTQPRTAGTGVLLLSDPSHLAAFDVAGDGSLVSSKWNGSSWSAWATVAPAASHTFLSGTCPDLDVHPEANGCAVLWTSTTTAGSVIQGKLVSVR